MGHVLYIDNTGYAQLEGYKNGLTDEYINDAEVTLKITDSNGDPINGLLNQITLNYESGSNGNYSARIDEGAEVVNRQIVNAVITAISSGIKSTFATDIIYKERRV